MKLWNKKLLSFKFKSVFITLQKKSATLGFFSTRGNKVSSRVYVLLLSYNQTVILKIISSRVLVNTVNIVRDLVKTIHER